MSETVELALPAQPLRYPIELVGRIVRGAGARGLEYRLASPLNVPCLLMARPSATPGDRWRSGIARHDGSNAPDLAAIEALAEGDYLYRIGAPLTPSFDERVTAIERLLGLVADDLEVAGDAEQDGRRDEATRIRSRALERIREMVAHPLVTVRGDA